MNETRSYGDPCGIARALDVIGERWALLVVRELALGPKRFTDLRRGMPRASPNVLSQRLRELEASGVVQQRSVLGAAYELTAWGRELHPILLALGRWGARSPARPKGALGVDALMVALESTFDADAAGKLRARYDVKVGEDRFAIDVDRGAIAIERRQGGSDVRKADATIETDTATLRALVFGDRKLADAPVAITGDRRAAKAFFRLFKRPAPIENEAAT
jgi:DNA-binding HxlR family transcriptional regulator